MNRHERRSTGAVARRGAAQAMREALDWSETRCSVLAAGLSAIARAELPEGASAEELTDRMVEICSRGLRDLEQGRLPPEGVAEMFDGKLQRVLIAEHACGDCEICRAREERIADAH